MNFMRGLSIIIINDKDFKLIHKFICLLHIILVTITVGLQENLMF